MEQKFDQMTEMLGNFELEQRESMTTQESVIQKTKELEDYLQAQKKDQSKIGTQLQEHIKKHYVDKTQLERQITDLVEQHRLEQSQMEQEMQKFKSSILQ